LPRRPVRNAAERVELGRVLSGDSGVLTGTHGVLTGYSGVLSGYSRGTHGYSGYSRGTHGVPFGDVGEAAAGAYMGYSRGTQGYSQGTHGVLTGYSRGTVRRRWRSRRRSLPTPSHSSPTAWSCPRPSPGTQVWGTPRGNPRVLTEYHKGYSRGYSMVNGFSTGASRARGYARVPQGVVKGC
jgi:hypothetical protein